VCSEPSRMLPEISRMRVMTLDPRACGAGQSRPALR
jgi:hypothetical protein